MNQVLFNDIGSKEYKEAWDFQNELFQGIVDIKLANRDKEIKVVPPNYFLFTEHPPVYTLGKSGDLSNLLLNEEELKKRVSPFLNPTEEGTSLFTVPGRL